MIERLTYSVGHSAEVGMPALTVFEWPPFGRCWGQTGHRDRTKMERMTRNGHALIARRMIGCKVICRLRGELAPRTVRIGPINQS